MGRHAGCCQRLLGGPRACVDFTAHSVAIRNAKRTIRVTAKEDRQALLIREEIPGAGGWEPGGFWCRCGRQGGVSGGNPRSKPVTVRRDRTHQLCDPEGLVCSPSWAQSRQ